MELITLISTSIIAIVSIIWNNLWANGRQAKQFTKQSELLREQFKKQHELQQEQFKQQNEMDIKIKRYDYLFHLVTMLVSEIDKRYLSIYQNYHKLLSKRNEYEQVMLIASISAELRDFSNYLKLQVISIENNLDESLKQNVISVEELSKDLTALINNLEKIASEENGIDRKEVGDLHVYVNVIGKSKITLINEIQIILSEQLKAINKSLSEKNTPSKI